MRIALHPDARAELRSAALWCDQRRAQWGEQFVDRVNAVLARIAEYPDAYPIWPRTGPSQMPIRKASIEQFPYFVAFEIHRERVLVLALAHGKRRPLYWLSRASPPG